MTTREPQAEALEQVSYQTASINVGRPQTVRHGGREYRTAIHKRPAAGPLWLSKLNFEGDGQADTVNHGGADKAVNVYPEDHYTYWERTLNRRFQSASFGENLTVRGLTEDKACIGDEFALGDAVLQVSQPRKPCYKLADKHGIDDFVERVVKAGFTGFYCRVLKEGRVNPGQELVLLRRHPAKISVADVNFARYRDRDNREIIVRILQAEALSGDWREIFLNRLGHPD